MKKTLFITIAVITLFATTSCKKENSFMPIIKDKATTALLSDTPYLPTNNLKDTPYGNIIIVDTPYLLTFADTPYTKR